MPKEPLDIVVDTREQRPWKFSENVRVLHGALTAGDYSLPGMEREIAIERKSLYDFLGCICNKKGEGPKNRDRFKRELERLAWRMRAFVIIEASWADIIAGGYAHTGVHPNSVAGSINAWSACYGVHFRLAGNRANAAKIAESLFTQFAKYRKEIHLVEQRRAERRTQSPDAADE